MELNYLFNEEVSNRKELSNKLKEIGFDLEYEIGVIGVVFDKDGKVVYQRRGPESSGDYNKLSDMGGAVEDSDVSFRDALLRELIEEGGNNFIVNFEAFLFAFVKNYFDIRLNKFINRVFLVYKLKLVDGEFIINEPGKALGYEKYNLDSVPVDEMMETSLFIREFYLKK